MEKILEVANRDEWRQWLSRNYNQANSVWLIFNKKSSGKKGITLEEAVEEALCFGWIDSQQKRRDTKTFSLRFSPRKDKSVWSKVNKERAEHLITLGMMTAAGLAKVEAAKKSGQWDSAYTNLTSNAIPSDLKEALQKNPQAWANFAQFSNSSRNLYIYWVNQAKTAQTRLKRIKIVVTQSTKNKRQFSLQGDD